MGRGAKIESLPEPLRVALDARLRGANYGDLVDTAAWITAKAFPVSKSSLHRYAQGLRASDEARSAEAALRRDAASGGVRALPTERMELLARLGAIEVERAQILAELLPSWRRDDPGSTPPQDGPEPTESSH